VTQLEKTKILIFSFKILRTFPDTLSAVAEIYDFGDYRAFVKLFLPTKNDKNIYDIYIYIFTFLEGYYLLGC